VRLLVIDNNVFSFCSIAHCVVSFLSIKYNCTVHYYNIKVIAHSVSLNCQMSVNTVLTTRLR